MMLEDISSNLSCICLSMVCTNWLSYLVLGSSESFLLSISNLYYNGMAWQLPNSSLNYHTTSQLIHKSLLCHKHIIFIVKERTIFLYYYIFITLIFTQTMFEARLEEVSIFRKIIDSIKEVVKMVNIEVNTKGLSIQAMDSCHTALVSLILREKAFSHYTCHKPLTIGLSIQNVAKILKIAGSDDSMTLQCQQEPVSLKFRFESKCGKKMSEFNLSLMNLEIESITPSQAEFSSVCVMSSAQFNRVCRQLGNFSETIRIQTNKVFVRFSIVGEVGNGNMLFNQNQSQDQKKVTLKVEEPVSLSFAGRYLSLFSKAAGLASQVSINMSSQTPLVVEYKLNNGAGELKYYLAPKIRDQQ